MTKLSIGKMHKLTGIVSSEAVAPGHPDKICDQISDALLDDALRQDAHARVAIETAIKDQQVWVFGEVSGNVDLSVQATVKRVLRDIGHADSRWGVDVDALEVRTSLSKQSGEIDAGVSGEVQIGAGDQGIMFGYATAETPERLPLPFALSRRLIAAHDQVRLEHEWLGPDAKAQVSVEYDELGHAHVRTVVLSSQHLADVSLKEVRELLLEKVVRAVFPALDDRVRVLINPAGSFVQGGPVADAGLTGRKIIADTYGGVGRHGGGAFSGKDATKVDRSAAYGARQLARSIVDVGVSEVAEVRLAYAIGVAEPVAIHVDIDDRDGQQAPTLTIDSQLFTPLSLIDRLELRAPRFEATARLGHFGTPQAWERTLTREQLFGNSEHG